MCACNGCDEMSCGLPDCDECEADKCAGAESQVIGSAAIAEK